MLKLLNCPKPFRDESISSYLMRLSLSNYYEKPSDLYKLLSLDKDGRISNYYIDTLLKDTDLQLISEVSRCDKAILEKLMLKVNNQDKNLYEFFDELIDITSICMRKIKICPLCLQQSKYIKKIWSLVNFLVCPHHEIMLVDKCDRCSKPLSWLNSKVFQCSCGFEYEKSKTKSASPDSLTISKIIFNKSGINSQFFPDTERIKIIDNIDLRSFDSIILYLAKHLTDKKVDHFSGVNSNVEHLSIIHSKVMEIFRKWPLGFHTFLEKVKMKRENNMYKNIMGDFGNFYRDLFRVRNYALILLRKEFINYILNNFTQYASANFVRISNKYEELILTGSSAARFLNISKAKLIRLINNLEIEGKISSNSKGNSIIVIKESLEKFKNKKKNWLSYTDAQRYLGVVRGIVELEKYGYITYFYNEYDYSNSKYFDQQSLDKFIETLQSKIIPSNTSHKALIDFKKVVKIGGKLCSTGLLVQLILNDVIQPRGLGPGNGLNKLMFDELDVKAFFKRKIVENLGEYLTTTKVASILGVKEHCINFWVKIGILQAESREGFYGKCFTLESIQQFNDNYISLDQIRSIYTPEIQISASKLAEVGLNAVTGNKIDGGFKYMYLKEDVRRILNTNI